MNLPEALDYYKGMATKHIDLIMRRLIYKEIIPHEENIFSIFESYTEWVKKGKRNGEESKREKTKEFKKLRKKHSAIESDAHISVLSGIWIPTGNLKLLGNHPILGFQMGKRKNKMTYNVTVAFKFLESKNDYPILRNRQVETSNHFFGGYVGFDLDRQIYKTQKSQIDLSAGVAYDGFDTVKKNTGDNNPNNDKSYSINSLNLNIGLGYKYFIERDWYISLQGKYNFVNYKNGGGTDFSGNNITITILTGSFINPLKTNILKILRYYE